MSEGDSSRWTERMGMETAVQAAGVRGIYRNIGGSLRAAAVLLALDVAFSGSILFSSAFCPAWTLISLLKSAIHRPGWGLALIRILIPILTYWLVYTNNAFQLRVAESNAQRVVAACEEFHAANGRFPKKLDELVPQYMNSVPSARYCLGPSSLFYYYYNSDHPMLVWQVVPPYYRKIYRFETRSWSYLD